MSEDIVERNLELNIIQEQPATRHENKCQNDIVDFVGRSDPENPLNWRRWYKWMLVVLISAISLTVNPAILMLAPSTPAILSEFQSNTQLEGTLLVSIWELGEVVGPLLLAPLSEIYGRLPVYHGATILFVLFSLVASESSNISMLIVFRFLLGVTVASSTLNSCLVADMFKIEQRGRALSIMGLVPYVAPCLGPIVGGFVSDSLGWRWTFRLSAIITGALEIGLLIALRESYVVVILERKAKRLRSTTGNLKLRSRYALAGSPRYLLAQSILRPGRLFFASPAIPLVAICGAFTMGYSYVVITSLTPIFEGVYHFSASQAGLSYFGLGVGMITGIVLSGLYIEMYSKRTTEPTGASTSLPEQRIALPLIIGYLLVPLGLIAIGWTAQEQVLFLGPLLCAVPVGIGFTSVTLASWSYLVEAFGVHAASATAAAIVVRNAASTVLPLAAAPLRDRFGSGEGFSILAAIALLFTPAPIVLVLYGGRWRYRDGM